MKTKLTILTFILLLTPCVYAQDSSTPQAPAWKTYTVKGGEFAVALPILPAVHWQNKYVDGEKKPRRELLVGSYADGVAYVVYMLENPKGRTPLKDYIAEQMRKDKGDLTDVSRDGLFGKVVRLDEAMVQFFAGNDRLYEFRALGVPPEDARMTRFFSSVSFARTTDAFELFPGPGLRDEQADISDEAEQKFYKGKDLTRKARLAMKPEPSYTEQARQNQVMGTVVLKCIFSADGSVKDIKVVSGLPHGLTEKAIDAATKIKFLPGQKDGKFVSMIMQLEYNFNLF